MIHLALFSIVALLGTGSLPAKTADYEMFSGAPVVQFYTNTGISMTEVNDKTYNANVASQKCTKASYFLHSFNEEHIKQVSFFCVTTDKLGSLSNDDKTAKYQGAPNVAFGVAVGASADEEEQKNYNTLVSEGNCSTTSHFTHWTKTRNIAEVTFVCEGIM